MNFYAKTLFLTITIFSIASVHAEKPIKPAGNLQICVLKETQAFATDYYGNLVFCAQGTCRKIMARPGKAIPQQLECTNNVALNVYSNNKLYRCTSANYLPKNKKENSCVIQVME
jgi:hypothetical protein